MARDVFDHHDRVIYHKARGNRQGHQAQVIDREAGQIHHGKGANQRKRHSHRRDDGSRDVTQEQVNHHHHQRHGHEELVLHIRDRSPDGRRTICQHINPGCRRQTILQLGKQLSDPVNDLDHVGARLALDIDDNGGLLIDPGCQVGVLLPFADLGNLTQSDGGAVAPGHNHIAVFVSRLQLVVSVNGKRAELAVEVPFRVIDVGVGHRRLDICKAQVHAGNHGRVDLDAHGRAPPTTH